MLEFIKRDNGVEVLRENVPVGLLRFEDCTPRIELATRYLRLAELREIAERLEKEAAARG